MLKVRRCYITLMEMLIVITILAMMTGLVGINIRRAFQQQRFRSEVDLMVDTLRLAQDLMLVVGADVVFSVYTPEGGRAIEYKLEVDGNIPKQWQPVVRRSHRRLQAIHLVEFIEDPSPAEGRIELRFFAGGAAMNRGILRLSTHEDPDTPGALKRVVVLRGYPHAIVSIPEGEDRVKLEDDEDAEFASRMTTYTIQEIREDAPPEEAPEPENTPNEEGT